MTKIMVLLNNPSAIFFMLFTVIALIILGFTLLVLMGNLTAMKLLAKNGVAVFCRNIVKDCKLLNYVNKEGVGWLSVPEVCYAPIMQYSGGKYIKNNFLSKPSLYGEIYITEGDSAKAIHKIGLPSDNVIKDLTIIRGSAVGNASNLRSANFSILGKCVHTLKDQGTVEICELGRTRYFKVGAIIDMTIGDLHTFKFDNRDAFIDSLLNFAKNISDIDRTKQIVLLQCKTEIDTLIVLLVEK